MDQNKLIEQILNARSFLRIKKALINLYESSEFEKSHEGLEKFKRYLKQKHPNIEKKIAEKHPIKGNGLVETLEDHFEL